MAPKLLRYGLPPAQDPTANAHRKFQTALADAERALADAERALGGAPQHDKTP